MSTNEKARAHSRKPELSRHYGPLAIRAVTAAVSVHAAEREARNARKAEAERRLRALVEDTEAE